MSSAQVRFGRYIIVLALVLATAITGFTVFEGLSPFDSVYLTIVTISTVGYGDIAPKTEFGKILAMFVILAGVGIFLFVFAQAIEAMVSSQESRSRMKKVNMVVGAFFSEAGVPLIRLIRPSIEDKGYLDNEMKIKETWTDQQFRDAGRMIGTHEFIIDIHLVDIAGVHGLLKDRRAFLVQLLQHPALFEHESFTDLLNAVFHLEEELSARDGLGPLPESDYSHLSKDTHRVISLLFVQWLEYLRHLKVNYPYLFSLAVRTNPFDAGASPIVR
ncbi:MAG TPA: potassium channel family protein [Methanoregulaceae archaeon]|nr:potassium channel family protein [Methanoregulaceae archaeon]